MKKYLLAGILFLSIVANGQKTERDAIVNMLHQQTKAWNKGDIETFMQTYWKNDSLMFIGKSGVTRGWQKTLDNYKRGYPDTAVMGKLAFDIIQVKKISPEYYFVVGKWMLTRSIGDLSGHYTLLLQKIKGKWVIIADHSS